MAEKHLYDAPNKDDPRPVVSLLIDYFGARAVSVAICQAQKALARGGEPEAERWRCIADVTRETLRSEKSRVVG